MTSSDAGGINDNEYFVVDVEIFAYMGSASDLVPRNTAYDCF